MSCRVAGTIWTRGTAVCYALTQDDVEEAWELARGRNDRKESKKVRSKKIDDKRSEIAPHYAGAIGEIAAARVFNTDTDWGFWDHGDGGDPDIMLRYDINAQIKFRTKRRYEFALNTTNPGDLKANIGILVVPAKDDVYYNPGDVVILRGYTNKLQLVLLGDDISMGKEPRRYITQDKMFPIYAGNDAKRAIRKQFAIYPKLRFP